MLHRLQQKEILSVRHDNAADPMLKAIHNVCAHYETEMHMFALCPEEVYMECIHLSDDILSKGESFSDEVHLLWHQLFNEYRRFDRAVQESEIQLAVTVVLASLCVCLNTSKHDYYCDTLVMLIMQQTFEQNKECSNIFKKIYADFTPYFESIDEWFDKRVNIKKTSPFEKYILRKDSKEKILQLLHNHIDQQTKPKDILKPLRAAIDSGVVSRPSCDDFTEEFQTVSSSTYERCTNTLADPHPYCKNKDFIELKSQFESI